MLSKLKQKSEFNYNIITLMTGTTIAQAIPIAISPIITRIYTPEDFGVFAIYISIISILASAITGKYELAILIPKNRHKARDIVVLSLSLSFICSLIIFFIIIFFIDSLLLLLNIPDIKIWLYFVPFNIFFIASATTLYYYNNRIKKYKVLSNNQIIQSSSQGFLNLFIGYFNKLSGGLVIGTFIANLISLIYLFIKTKIFFRTYVFQRDNIIKVIKEYNKFPKYNLSSNFLENISSQVPIFLLGAFFNTAVVGFYSLSQRVISIPIGIFGRSVGDVFRQEAIKQLNEKGNCREIFVSTFKKLLLISLLPFSLFYFAAPELFNILFGNDWIIAGEYAKILTPLFFLQFIASPMSNMFMIAQKQEYDLILQIYLLAVVCFSFYSGYYIFNSIEISLYIFTFLYSIKYIFELFLSYKFTIKGK
ncbi:lipopolysaccharide biosynthesis protein [Aliarcobacter cryaerophilus]|uniref:lipopolysaccharide biosynthesis protein n=1 Tax=Aliarcobacter cryaerophilus TaxID=28198 RepID=UPI00165209E9|nr:oligosaccharide flippase family protein [Aliarcobacter cryaerophilus]